MLAVMLGLAILVILYLNSGSREAAAPKLALVTATKLNCRTTPSPQAPVSGVAERGMTLVVEAQSGSWRRVRLDGAACWVSGDFLQPTGAS